MSFIYPRTITISRQITNISGVGSQNYQALNKTNEVIQHSNVPASIQHRNFLSKPPEGLPGDTVGTEIWYIFFKLPLGAVLDRDIITDDKGNRYQVGASYWNSLGYRCKCERLQV